MIGNIQFAEHEVRETAEARQQRRAEAGRGEIVEGKNEY